MTKINNKFLFFLLAIFLILALFFNVNNFLGFFDTALGNYNFNNGDFTGALDYHKKAENYIKNNTINYNLGGDYYKLGDYKNSKEYYDKIKTGTGEKEDLDMDYNLGNAFYKLGEHDPNTQNKVNLWKESLGNYKKILDKKTDKKTKENYDFVEKKLKNLEDKQDKKSDNQDQQEDQKSGDSKDSKENKDNQQGQEGKNEQTKDKKESDNKEGEQKQDKDATNENKSGQGTGYDIKKDSQLKELSEDEKKQLEQYNEELKQAQKDNGKLFGKKSQGDNNSQDIFDIFNQDPFFKNSENFDNSILNQNEKDW